MGYVSHRQMTITTPMCERTETGQAGRQGCWSFKECSQVLHKTEAKRHDQKSTLLWTGDVQFRTEPKKAPLLLVTQEAQESP